MLLKLAADRPTKLMITRSDDGTTVTHSTPRVSRVAPVPASAWATPSPATSSSVASPSERSHNGVVKSEPLDTDIFPLRLDTQVLQEKVAPVDHHESSGAEMPLPSESPSSSATAGGGGGVGDGGSNEDPMVCFSSPATDFGNALSSAYFFIITQ